MKDRRSFFTSLALLAGATSVSPMIFLPKFEPVKWKQITTQWYYFEHDGTKMPFDPRKYCGEWKFVFDDGVSLRVEKITIDSSLRKR